LWPDLKYCYCIFLVQIRKTTKFLVMLVSAWSRFELDTSRIEVEPFKVRLVIINVTLLIVWRYVKKVSDIFAYKFLF
jgi:hypothetical protein